MPDGGAGEASAAGLKLVLQSFRAPCGTTTYEMGELIRAALNAGAEHILVGCGNSGTSGGGAEAAQALGVRLFYSEMRAIE